MSVDQYWQGRLVAGFPLYDRSLCTEGYDVRSWSGKTGGWPRAVARQSLFVDYLSWYEGELRPGYLRQEYYVLNPNMVPGPFTEFQFFVAIAPWLYVDGKDWHVRNYMVKKSERHNGEWVRVNARRYFVRLCPLERHVQAFEASVGRPIRASREKLSYT